MFEQVQPQKYYMQIARQIKNSIQEGKLKAGDKLPSERTLAKEFGASRASIREALSALEMLGLIVCKSGQGNFINADASEGSMDTELVKSLLMGHAPNEIFETRLELEPRLAGLAAERSTAEELLVVRKIHANLMHISKRVIMEEKGALEELLEEDRKLHLAIGKASHNAVMITLFSALNLMMKERHWVLLNSKALEKPEILRKYLQLSGDIIGSLGNRDADKVRREMFSLIKTLEEDIFSD